MVNLSNVSYSYHSPTETTRALNSITAEISSGSITAVIGAAGSGKSTLSEIISGITAPESGSVTIDGKPAGECSRDIGMVFQYPEYQLFAETVYDDIAYGPKNLGLSGKELDARVKTAAETVGLKPELLSAEPFDLSGGEKRLAALAGILAMQPSVLVLDEPAAGLDPRGRAHMFDIIRGLIKGSPNMTIVFVTHSMEDAAEFAEDIIVLKNGSLAAHGSPEAIFNDTDLLSACGLDAPEAVRLARELKALEIDIGNAITTDDVYSAVLGLLYGGIGHAS